MTTYVRQTGQANFREKGERHVEHFLKVLDKPKPMKISETLCFIKQEFWSIVDRRAGRLRSMIFGNKGTFVAVYKTERCSVLGE